MLYILFGCILILNIINIMHYKKIQISMIKKEENKEKELQKNRKIIKDLRRQIENIEEDHFAEFLKESRIFDHPIEERRANFYNNAIPTILLDQNFNIVEANKKFYQNIKTESKESITGKYYPDLIEETLGINMGGVIEKMEFVLETGQSEILDRLDVIEKTILLYRMYISRFQTNKRYFIHLQFVNFPVAPKKIIDYDDKLTLGILKDGETSAMLLSKDGEILDINFKAIKFLKENNISFAEKKIYTIFPSLNSKGLEELCKNEFEEIIFFGNVNKVRVAVTKIVLQIGTYYIMFILA